MSDWRKRAACLGQPTERFFPEDTNEYRHIVSLCEGCVVKRACLDEALQVPMSSDRYGVFGGLTPPQRRRLRADRQVSAPPPPEVAFEATPLRWNPGAGRYEAVR